MNSQGCIISLQMKVTSFHLLGCQIQHSLHLTLFSEAHKLLWPQALVGLDYKVKSHFPVTASWKYFRILGWEIHLALITLPRVCKPSFSSFTMIVSSSNSWLSRDFDNGQDFEHRIWKKKKFLCLTLESCSLSRKPSHPLKSHWLFLIFT